MQVRTSKEVTDRQKAGAFVQWALRVQGPAVADDLTQLFSPQSELAEGPGFHSLIQNSADMLQSTLDALVAADEAHYDEKAAHSALVKKRNNAVDQTARIVIALRRGVLAFHDQADLGRFGFGGETAREAVPLLRQAERVLMTVELDDLSDILGESVVEGLVFDAKPFREVLSSRVETLRAVVAELGEARRTTERAFLDKEKKKKVYDRLFLREGRSFEDWCRVVGREELARRVRPSVSRPGRTEELPPEVPEGTEIEDVAAEEASTETPEATQEALATRDVETSGEAEAFREVEAIQEAETTQEAEATEGPPSSA
jgi:hypothetical protein